MAADYSKILTHPDKEEIISKLVSGVTPKSVADWLKLKYTDKNQKHLRLSNKILSEFTNSNLNLYETLQQDIKIAKDNEKQISASLRNNKVYQERMNEIASNEIDIKKLMVETGTLIKIRVEQYFDKMQENPGNLKADYGLIKYFETLINFAEKYDKIVNQAPDQIIQHNVNIQVMDQYVALLQECIRSTLAEIDTDAAALFLEKFNENLGKLTLPEELQPAPRISQDKRLQEAKIIATVKDDFDFPEIS